MRKRKGMPTVLSVALVLLCLVLVTAHFTTGMYARYTTRSKGDDTGRVASFKVSASSDQNGPVSIEAVGNRQGVYSLKLNNPGDVTVRYTANVVFDKSDDAGLFEPIEPLTGEIAPKGNVTREITFDMSGYLGGGAGNVPFTVVVTFAQVD